MDVTIYHIETQSDTAGRVKRFLFFPCSSVWIKFTLIWRALWGSSALFMPCYATCKEYTELQYFDRKTATFPDTFFQK